MKRKILVLELWGIGDLSLSTVLIAKAVEAGDEVHVLSKRHGVLLLQPTFPGLHFFLFDAGWTKFHDKYHLWKWNWKAFFRLLTLLRKERYDAVVSARDDPRDHLLMALIGARERYGFPHHGSRVFLTHPVTRTHGFNQHKAEDWRDLGVAMGFSGMDGANPQLDLTAYRSPRMDALFESARKPVVVLHAGARIAVRRWPEAYFRDVIGRLRAEFSFHLVLIPDPDGYGTGLAPLADTVLEHLSLAELTDAIGRADLLLCNDSGPAHLAAACGRPAIALFGPTKPEWFRPWGPLHKIIQRDLCPLRPCFDYCRFPEPYCMTRLLPGQVWPEIRGHLLQLVDQGVLPRERFLLPEPEPSPAASAPHVVAIVATFRRPDALARMLRSLQGAAATVSAVVVDNADDPATAAVTESEGQRMEIIRLVPGENLSCGGGLAFGERFALKHFADKATHFLLSDDDVELSPGTLDRLLEAMRQENAALACPMITWPDGIIGWFPGLLEAPPFDAIRKQRVQTPGEYLERFGPRPIRFSWATGACLLATRGALEELGLHRTDFWLRGEDFEFSLRLSARHPAIFVPDTLVLHHCFGALQTPEAVAMERRKQVAMLHNTAYIACRLPHGRRILRCLPGNLWRHAKNWGAGSVWEGLAAYWRGGMGGFPVGGRADTPLRLLVFAHTPPPHHGQSFMVELMLGGFGGDARKAPPPPESPVACYHVNCRVSSGVEDIGSMRFGKIVCLLGYCAEAIWCRFRHGVRMLYYVPAPGKRFALYRDWIVMALCRPFFPRLVLHWHATGLTKWLDQEGSPAERWITRVLLGRPTLSIPLAGAGACDGEWLGARHTVIVPNGIPDPCPHFETLLAHRRSRAAEACRLLQIGSGEPFRFRLLFIAHCTREKGLFDALEAVALLNGRASTLRAHLTVAGAFMNIAEEQAFRERIAQPDLAGAVTYAGFVSGASKQRLFEENDCLCFPTYYPAESFGLVVVEAMAFGMTVASTRWHAIPELLPPDYPRLAEPRSPEQLACLLEQLAASNLAEALRARFLEQFSEESHLRQLASAFRTAARQA